MVGTFNGQSGFVVARQGKGWYTSHIFADEAHFRTWMSRTRPGNIVKATAAHGHCVRGIDHRFSSEDDPEEGTDMQTNQSQAQSQAARASTPAPAQSPLKTDDMKRLDFMARLTSSSEAQLDVLREMRSLMGVISSKLDTLIDRAESQPAAAIAATANGSEAIAGNYRDFTAETLNVGMDDNGKPVYKIRGGPFTKFGVRVWPEVMSLIGVEIEDLKPGPNQFNAQVRAILDEKGQAKKVVGLAK